MEPSPKWSHLGCRAKSTVFVSDSDTARFVPQLVMTGLGVTCGVFSHGLLCTEHVPLLL